MAGSRSMRYGVLESRVARIEQLLGIQAESDGEPTSIELRRLCGETDSRVKTLECLVGKLVSASGHPTEQEGAEYTAEDQRPFVDARRALWEIKEKVALIEEKTKGLDSSLELQFEQIREAIAIIQCELERRNDTDEIFSLKNDLKQVKGQVNLLVKAASLIRSSPEMSWVKLPDPKAFDGVRDAKEVENYLFDMEQYFKLAKTAEDAKISLASLYLIGDAKLWWRTKINYMEHDRCPIDSWDVFKKELKSQFYPENVEYVIRMKLFDLEQTGSVQEYIRIFTAYMSDIQDMSEVDRLFYFTRGLKQWARTKLNRQHIPDLTTAIIAAEQLDDQSESNVEWKSIDKTWNEARPNELGRSVGGAQEQRSFGGDKRPFNGRDSSNLLSKFTPLIACYQCGGPHRIRECPKRMKVNSLSLQRGKNSDPIQEE